MQALPTEKLKAADSLIVHLFGSLSATGIGHGTPNGITAGLMGILPEDATCNLMDNLYANKSDTYQIKYAR